MDLEEFSEEELILNAIKENLKQFRQTKNLSLDKLASRCGVSRAMISQIEQGKSVPTISVLWKIASGLGVSFQDLLKEQNKRDIHIIRSESTKVLYSSSKVFYTRALFPFIGARKTEFYELYLQPGGIEVADAHQSGTTENIVVVQGKLRLRVGENLIELGEGDSVYFKADIQHEYSNPGDQEAKMFLVMEYRDEIG